jgi:DNA-binding XRE family transcriptional regulator
LEGRTIIETISVEKQQELINILVERLPQIRKEMKISQTELGKKVGLSRQTISSIERGTVELSWNNYLAIMMFIVANRNKCKTMYQDDSQELIEVLNVVDMKL